jgi:branched-chain amino acid transport system substrate-binding protein
MATDAVTVGGEEPEMKQRRDRQAHRFGAALLGASLVLAGCGSTRSDNEFAQARAAASGGIPAGGNATPSPAPTATGTAPAAEVPAAVPAAASGATGQAPSVGGVSNATTGASGRTAAAVPQGAAPASRVAAGPALAAPSSSAAAGPVAAPRPGEGVPAAPSPVASGPKATIVLGSVGTESGPIGQQLLPLLPAARAWVSDVNARGGLNGHPVKLITGDDGGDPNRALSLARRMVDEDKAVAFYMERMPTTMQAVASFLEERKVPLLGSCNCTDAAARSPMVFEVGPGGGLGFGWAHLAPLLAFSDKRKLAIFYCREVATCTTIRNNVRRLVGPAGVQIVNEAQVTLT